MQDISNTRRVSSREDILSWLKDRCGLEVTYGDDLSCPFEIEFVVDGNDDGGFLVPEGYMEQILANVLHGEIRRALLLMFGVPLAIQALLAAAVLII